MYLINNLVIYRNFRFNAIQLRAHSPGAKREDAPTSNLYFIDLKNAIQLIFVYLSVQKKLFDFYSSREQYLFEISIFPEKVW